MAIFKTDGSNYRLIPAMESSENKCGCGLLIETAAVAPYIYLEQSTIKQFVGTFLSGVIHGWIQDNIVAKLYHQIDIAGRADTHFILLSVKSLFGLSDMCYA